MVETTFFPKKIHVVTGTLFLFVGLSPTMKLNNGKTAIWNCGDLFLEAGLLTNPGYTSLLTPAKQLKKGVILTNLNCFVP